MTLGAEEEKQFHSRFPFSCSLHPIASHPPISFYFSLSLSLFCIFSSDTRHPYTTFTIRHERELGWENAFCQWSPRNRNDCNLHKLSFHFDDDVTEAPKAEKRGIVNDKEDRILCILYFRIFRSSWYNMEFLARKTSKPLYLIYIIFGLSLWYIKRQSKIKM